MQLLHDEIIPVVYHLVLTLISSEITHTSSETLVNVAQIDLLKIVVLSILNHYSAMSPRVSCFKRLHHHIPACVEDGDRPAAHRYSVCAE